MKLNKNNLDVSNFQNGVITFDCAMTTPKVTESIIGSGNKRI
jgi:hypothetical protein